MTRVEIVTEARAWIGTPFRWQASVKSKGVDCKGLIVGIARELGLPEAASIYAAIADYRKVDPRLLKRGLGEVFAPTASPLPGDVMLLIVAGAAQHLAIMTEPNRMIHTYGKGPRAVIEVPIGRSRLIDSYWTWRSIDG